MAINVDTVYKTVMFVINKEQRGYITPAEFNDIANQAQLEIFEKYFESYSQALRMPEDDTDYGNRLKSIEEKIYEFNTMSTVNVLNSGGNYNSVVYKIGTVVNSQNNIESQPITFKEISKFKMSKLTQPSLTNPYYYLERSTSAQTSIILQPAVTDSSIYNVNYIKRPIKPFWGYETARNGNYVYNPTESTDFEISEQDQTDLILLILMYAGVVIRDTTIIQAAAGELGKEDANDKS